MAVRVVDAPRNAKRRVRGQMMGGISGPDQEPLSQRGGGFHAYPLSLKLSLRAKRGNLVAGKIVSPSARSQRRFTPRDDKLGTHQGGGSGGWLTDKLDAGRICELVEVAVSFPGSRIEMMPRRSGIPPGYNCCN